MPNHFHGIVIITDNMDRGAHTGAPLQPSSTGDDAGTDPPIRPNVNPDAVAPVGADPCTRPNVNPDAVASGGAALRVCPDMDTRAPLPTVVQWFKTMTTNEYIRGVRTLGWSPFPGRFWQRNYYEHIIRDDASLNRIRQYIADNPMQWDNDNKNPTQAAR